MTIPIMTTFFSNLLLFQLTELPVGLVLEGSRPLSLTAKGSSIRWIDPGAWFLSVLAYESFFSPNIIDGIAWAACPDTTMHCLASLNPINIKFIVRIFLAKKSIARIFLTRIFLAKIFIGNNCLLGCLPWHRVISLDLSFCPLHCNCRLAWLATTLKDIQHQAGYYYWYWCLEM